MEEHLKEAFETELYQIYNYWADLLDHENGGFFGQVNQDQTIEKKAAKGSVLNARILWFFSAVHQHRPSVYSLALAERSYQYLKNYLIDTQCGGLYWSVNFQGQPLDTKKQIYAIAFGIYGLTEFYKASQNHEALALAKSLYLDIERYSFDKEKNGYLEAFTREWTELADLRLSDKDANEKKTMNTHLHILEAYSNLYSVWPNEQLGAQLRNLLELFAHKIVNQETYHLDLFFDEDWQPRSNVISFGHDVEASWLLLEAAETLNDETVISQFRSLALKLAKAATPGLDNDGGLAYESDQNHINKQKHWWVQAEAMVGFFNAFELTNNLSYYDSFLRNWNFVKDYIIDKQYGEWHWGVDHENNPMHGEYKVGMWKCPYHNGRACLEIIKRFEKKPINPKQFN